MGICSGISTKWLFFHCFQIELEFRSVYFHVIISGCFHCKQRHNVVISLCCKCEPPLRHLTCDAWSALTETRMRTPLSRDAHEQFVFDNNPY